MLEPGTAAPDFTLRSTAGDPVTLSALTAEGPVTIVFIPFAFTGVCQGELCEIRDDLSMFESAGTKVVAISCDSGPVQKRWAEEQGYTFPLLSDFWPHGAVSTAYGVFNEALGCAMRGTFLVAKGGEIVASFQSAALGTARSKDEYQAALAKLA